MRSGAGALGSAWNEGRKQKSEVEFEVMGTGLLGMAGPWAKDNREASDPYTCKIGGLPDWPLPKHSINPQFIHCASCGTQLCLLAQVYSPISVHIQHRFLFIFGCITPTCGTASQSWRVLRVQKIHDADDDDHKSQQTCVHDDHDEAFSGVGGGGCNDASSSSEVRNGNVLEEDLNDVENKGDVDFGELSKALFAATTFTSSPDTKSSKKKKPRKKRQQHNLPATELDTDTPVLPCFYIYTLEEPASKDLSSVCSSYSSLSIKENESDIEDHSQTEESWEKEQYEYDKALTADRIYLKFKKRLDAYPEQCFRYSYGGKPILAAAAEIDPGRCSHCGRPRQFEMQLMPPLLYFLQEALDDDQRQMIENWEWMTLIVFTCSENCYENIEQAKSDSKGWIVAEEAMVAQYEESMPNQLSFFS